jgi:peroxiredoxin Q/BCP
MRVVSKLGLAALVLAAVAVAVSAGRAEDKKAEGVKVGDAAPTFEATDDAGKAWKSSDHVGKKVLVVYFYPADFTGGCTKQACAYRDESTKLADKNVEVVGVSGDSADNHKIFKKEYKLNFTLLADEDGSLMKKFGIPLNAKGGQSKATIDGKELTFKQGVRAERWTIVIGKDGKVLFKEKVSAPAEDAKKVLDVIEKAEKK